MSTKYEPLTPDALRTFARVGALTQAKLIVAEFPDILADLNRFATASNGASADGASSPTRTPRPVISSHTSQVTPRRRRRMSAAERRAVGVRMRAYWKTRRAAKGRA